MWNEANVVGGDTEGLKVGHVMDVGRNWFRMTPVPQQETAPIAFGDTTLPQVRIAASLFDRSPAPADRGPEASSSKRRGRVTAPWWLLVVAGAALLATGAAGAVAAFRINPATIVSAFTAAGPAFVPAQPPAPSMIEPTVEPVIEPLIATPPALPPASEIVATTALADSEPAPVARPVAKAPARRARSAPRKRASSSRAGDEQSAADKVWVDPFAE